MSVILRLGAVNTDSPYSRIVSEESDYDKPVDMSPVAEDPCNSPPQTYPGCFGLPYQDHNYGAPPPPTPPQTPPVVTPTVKETVEVKEEIVVTSDIPTLPTCTVAPMTPEPLQDEDVDDPTRCICDFVHDDGYMIQCDKCSVWQHIVCMGLDRDSIPDVYFCEVCNPRSVDRVRAREFQIRKREFLKSLVIKSHDSSTDTDPEEVNNRLKAYGLDPPGSKNKQKMKLKKRKERSNSKSGKRLKIKEMKTEKENTSCEINRRNKLLVKDFSSRTAQVKREKLSKKIEKMRAERLSKEMKEDKFSSDDLKEDEKIINTINTIPAPLIQEENAQNPWDMNTFNEWEQSYEVARYNQYTTYVQEYLNSTCINGHHNDIADLVTDGLRVQRCRVKALKNKRKGLESSCSIPNGQPVIEVIGKIMTRQQYDKDNFGQRQLSPFVFFYGSVFDLDLVIDASDYGNDARFIRRSCQPNASVHHVVAGGQAHFIAVASKEVTEGCEITIPFDYDYKKWNYCVECACLRNNCPVSRFQKRRLRFQKLQQQNVSSPNKKFHKHDKIPKLTIKTPVKSPTKSPVKTPVKTPEKVEVSSPIPTPTPETIHVSPQMPSPTKMVRRSQVSRQNSSNASTQASSGRVRSLRVPSQNSDDNSVNESLTIPEPSSMRFSETDHLTSPEAVSDSNKDGVNNTDTPKPEEKKKLTREERKMEAIMKAFEKMEKRNARKASQDQCKVKTPQDQLKVKDVEPVKEKEKEEQCPKLNPKKKEKVVKKVEPQVVKEEPQCGSDLPLSVASPEKKTVTQCKVETNTESMDVDVDNVKQEPEEVKEEERTRPNLRERPPPPPKTKKAKKTGGRRRVRNTSGAGTLSTETPSESNEENSNSAPPQATSCPVTPVVQLESAATPPSFLLRKTKRHLMNEWLSEKSFETTKSEPLEVAVEEDNMFVTCLPSPRNSMDRLRRNSASAGVRERSSSLLVETSVGSAKKRWLRQAMGEGSNESSGMSSPVPPSGGMSPNPQATMSSPGGSPPIDFVTPLKKRRLARESLSRESTDSPSQTPTPVTQASSSYFSSLSESLDNFKNKNGFSTLFSPLKPSDFEMEVKSDEKSEVSAIQGCSQVSTVENLHREEAGPSHLSNNMEVIPDNSVDETAAESEAVDVRENVSSCAEMDCSVQCDTGTEVCHGDSVTGAQISNTMSEVVEPRTVNSEQMNVCDHEDKSANSEPDSSDSVCRGSESIQMDVECDSGTSGSQTAVVDTAIEVDSTETSVRLHDVKSMSENATQCDSCNSERTNSTALDTSSVAGPSSATDTNTCMLLDGNLPGRSVVTSNLGGPSTSSETSNLAGPSSVSDNKVCASSSIPLSSPSLVINNVIDSSSFTNKTVLDRLTQVDSSTDQPRTRRNSVSGSLLLESAVTSNSTSNILTEHNIHHPSVHNTTESLENEVSNSFAIDNVGSNVNRNLVGSVNFTDPFSVSSNSSSDIAPMPNRHLKFLSDSSYGADTTVDSTTQFVSSVGTSNLLNSSVLPGMIGYDSDSMDVTSASETGLGAGYDESRRGSEDSLTGFLEPMSSTSIDPAQVPKEKKKVSLQEYLKRKKEKGSTSGTPVSPSFSSSAPVAGPSKVSTVSSTTTTSPLKLANPITLKKLDEKLPPLPSLPSLPMFEKTERKEFKSSSDLLSPIFNREKKQEEVRKPMSLSERLKQEFGLDDSTDNDTDTDQKPDQMMKGSTTNGNLTDVPPPPPPPPQNQASRPSRITNGGAVQSLLNIKTYPSSSLKTSVESSSSATIGGASSSVPMMVPPPPPGSGTLKNNISVAVPSMVPPPNSKPHLASTLQAPLSNLLSNVKNPQKLQNDLTAQLAAIKAQISKVQKSLPNPSSSSSLSSGVDQLGTNTTANGISSTGSKPQVFDYGHQSGTNFLRQNSHPGSSTSKNFQSYKKSSPSASFGKVSPRLKVSPTLLNHSFNNSNSHSQNGPGNQSFNNHRDLSPSSWNQKRATPTNNHSVNRKPFTKQTSHKY